MSTASPVTADQLLQLPTGMGKRYELVAGALRVMSPSGWRHGKVVSKLHARLVQFVEQHDLGEMFGAETGFRIAREPDTVRAPDIAFIKKGNLPTDEPREAYWPGPPDLAVEVLSPDDRTQDVNDKTEAWLAAGSAAVWIVDPTRQTVTVHLSTSDVQVYSSGERLSGEPVVPRFSCQVDELFG